jgi:hypothetical protein
LFILSLDYFMLDRHHSTSVLVFPHDFYQIFRRAQG